MDSWMLGPHSHGLMPLDFCLWDEIEERTLAEKTRGTDAQATYAKRPRQTALRLPKALVTNCLGKMKENVEAMVAAGGKHTELD